MFIYFTYVGLQMNMYIPWHICGGQKTTCRDQVSPSTILVMRIQIRLPGLVANILTQWSILSGSLSLHF